MNTRTVLAIGLLAAGGASVHVSSAAPAGQSASAGPDVPVDRGLDGAYDPNNPFARILRGELPASRVFEDDHVLAFMPIRMQSPGHVLVISKTSRARNLVSIEPEELTRMMLVVRRIARAQRAALKPDGVRITQNSGAAAGQSVFHLHFHVIPMYAGRALRSGEGPDDPREELDAMARRLAAALRD